MACGPSLASSRAEKRPAWLASPDLTMILEALERVIESGFDGPAIPAFERPVVSSHKL